MIELQGIDLILGDEMEDVGRHTEDALAVRNHSKGGEREPVNTPLAVSFQIQKFKNSKIRNFTGHRHQGH